VSQLEKLTATTSQVRFFFHGRGESRSGVIGAEQTLGTHRPGRRAGARCAWPRREGVARPRGAAAQAAVGPPTCLGGREVERWSRGGLGWWAGEVEGRMRAAAPALAATDGQHEESGRREIRRDLGRGDRLGGMASRLAGPATILGRSLGSIGSRASSSWLEKYPS
jgi:hypothetical protein